MFKRALCVALVAGGVSASSQASVFFSFADPATGPEITYTFVDSPGAEANQSNESGGTGFVSFSNATLSFIVDGTEEGLGVQTYDATLSMSLFIGQVLPPSGDILTAPIAGGTISFDLVNSGVSQNILTGVLTGGSLITLGSSGALLSTSTTDGLTLAAGTALSSFLNGQSLAPIFDIAFTMTNISEPPVINQFGFLSSFTASSAFSGNAELVPSPGSAALAGISLSLLLIRRKRS